MKKDLVGIVYWYDATLFADRPIPERNMEDISFKEHASRRVAIGIIHKDKNGDYVVISDISADEDGKNIVNEAFLLIPASQVFKVVYWKGGGKRAKKGS